jgi:hypothetical protein
MLAPQCAGTLPLEFCTMSSNDATGSSTDAMSQPPIQTLDIGQIMDFLPHRYPFLLIDRVVELTRAKRIVAIKNVTINEPFFRGIFPAIRLCPACW